ncbi:MAG: HAD-IC family P-type ATPase [Bacillota bacterium]|nr:HAD-IC family P-type ATPase [Bacillota bacterium]
MKTENFRVSGMSCAACSANVERLCRSLEGVAEANVNLTTERLTITYDETLLSKDFLFSKVKSIGYGLHDLAEAKIEEKEPNIVLALILAAIEFCISMGSMYFKFSSMPVLQMLLAIAVMLIGKKYFISGYKALFHGVANMDSLVAISCSVSFIYSTINLIAGKHEYYFESCAVVLALIMLGKHMEASSKKKTLGAINALLDLAPAKAIRLENGAKVEVAAEDLEVGDLVFVKKGMAFPMDGIIIDGSSSVDESMLTGESRAVEKSEGDNVVGGSINLKSDLFVKITKVGSDTVLSQIIKLVEDAQTKKAPIASLADKIAAVFVPTVIGIALISAIVWAIIGQPVSFVLKIFTCVLVIACPCALGLATPTAIIVGTGMGAGCGILIKSGEALQRAAEIDTVVFDKTGTLTCGIIKENEAGVDTSEDKIRPEAKEAVSTLEALGLEVIMLSGDKKEFAESIAKEIGIKTTISGVLPDGKNAEIEKLQNLGRSVMMVGDGINDAPALTAANVGIAIGSGTDVAIESADIVLMKSDPRDVAKAIRLSKYTMRHIKQNLFWAFFYNCIGIPIAFGALYPSFGILLSPMIGGLAMACSSVFVVSNALRLKTRKL